MQYTALHCTNYELGVQLEININPVVTEAKPFLIL